MDVAAEAGAFETLLAAADAAGLVEALRGDGPLTVFAPTDEAFGKLGRTAVRDLLKPENRDRLTRILTYHVVPGRVSASELNGRRTLKTLSGQRLEVSLGAGRFVDESRIAATDIEASNGIIHVIDAVLLPEQRNLVEVASEAGSFETLLAAAEAAGLVEALTGEGPYTVFAPTDEAFGSLPAGTLEGLLQARNRRQLQSILAYHVVPARIYADEVLEGAEASTLLGPSVEVGLRDGRLTVNGSRVLQADIESSNAVIHVIDGVLLPPDVMRSSVEAPAAEVIRLAIERGVPRFNDGDPAACAAIYEVTIAALLQTGRSELTPSAERALEAAWREGGGLEDPTDRAWAYRRGLDAALTSIVERARMQSSRDRH